MGLKISVYRDNGPDCSNNGPTKHFHHLTVVNIDGPDEPTMTAPAVLLIDKRETGSPNPKLVPEVDFNHGAWLMFGGNYAGTSDSRFSDAMKKLTGVSMGICKVHDRMEG